MDSLLSTLQEKLNATSTTAGTVEIKLEYLGKKGKVNAQMQSLKDLDGEAKKEAGQKLNALKLEIEKLISEKEASLADQTSQKFPLPKDSSLPGVIPQVGHLHPTTELQRSMNQFFHFYGFSFYDGPEIETDEFNFDKLNLPPDHPAREMQDTLYISEPELLLRTHTSSVETRAMTQEELPIRIVVPGKVYRNETTNTTNNSFFYQYEGLVVDRGITLANLKWTLETFAKFIYGENIKTRFRCKYYPQVEPGVGLDIECTFCHTKGCSVCKYRGYIEALGAGMVHPNVLKACGIDAEVYTGFAFGMGLDRLVMLKYGISDIRALYNGELVWVC